MPLPTLLGSPDMVVLRAHGVGLPLTFLVDQEGYALVSCLRLSLRFNFQEDSISVEEEIFDDLTSELSHTVGQLSISDESNCRSWRLAPGRYRVYGLTDSQMAASTEILTPRRSSTCTVQNPLPSNVTVKVEPGLENPHLENIQLETGTINPIITLSSDEDSSPPKTTRFVSASSNPPVQSKSPAVVFPRFFFFPTTGF